MPTIANLPAYLHDQHMNWHMYPGQPQKGGRAFLSGMPGSGVEFLTFHRSYLVHFHAWYDAQQGHDASAVAAWTVLPPELKTVPAGWDANWAANELRITTNTPQFATADQLGIYIETGIHDNFLHHAAAVAYNEPLLESPMTSPQSTHFYQLHGMITIWWNHWASLQKRHGKEIVDNKHFHKELIKEKEAFFDNKHSHKEIEKIQKDKDFEKLHKELEKIHKDKDKDIEKIQKDKDKDVFENPGLINQGDPGQLISQLSQRISALEGQMASGQPFIQTQERPDVGGQVVAGPGANDMASMPGMGNPETPKPNP